MSLGPRGPYKKRKQPEIRYQVYLRQRTSRERFTFVVRVTRTMVFDDEALRSVFRFHIGVWIDRLAEMNHDMVFDSVSVWHSATKTLAPQRELTTYLRTQTFPCLQSESQTSTTPTPQD